MASGAREESKTGEEPAAGGAVDAEAGAAVDADVSAEIGDSAWADVRDGAWVDIGSGAWLEVAAAAWAEVADEASLEVATGAWPEVWNGTEADAGADACGSTAFTGEVLATASGLPGRRGSWLSVGVGSRLPAGDSGVISRVVVWRSDGQPIACDFLGSPVLLSGHPRARLTNPITSRVFRAGIPLQHVRPQYSPLSSAGPVHPRRVGECAKPRRRGTRVRVRRRPVPPRRTTPSSPA
jgi:hypothetical protein